MLFTLIFQHNINIIRSRLAGNKHNQDQPDIDYFHITLIIIFFDLSIKKPITFACNRFLVIFKA